MLEITKQVYCMVQKKYLNVCFYDTGTRHEKALSKNVPRVRDPEETILCPRVMDTNTFFPLTFFLDVNFFKIFTAQRIGVRE